MTASFPRPPDSTDSYVIEQPSIPEGITCRERNRGFFGVNRITAWFLIFGRRNK